MKKSDDASIQMIADIESGMLSDIKDKKKYDEEMPILATRNMVMFPHVVAPIIINRKASKRLISKLEKNPDSIAIVVCQKKTSVEEPKPDDLYEYGVYARLLKTIEIPTPKGKMKAALMQTFDRCKIVSYTAKDPYMKGFAVCSEVEKPIVADVEFSTAYDDFIANITQYIKSNEEIPSEALSSFIGINDPFYALDYACTNFPFSIQDKIEFLRADSYKARILIMLSVLSKDLQLLQLKQDIRTKTHKDLDDQQKTYFLKQQIKNIQAELDGGKEGSHVRRDLEKKAQNKKWSKEVAEIFNNGLDKLDTYVEQSPEYSMQLNYLQLMVDLPWGEYTTDNLDINRALKILNHDHYDMEKVKERILEYMAVLKLRGDLKSPILCLYGPPGVGKTSLGKSIAKSMNRKYVRMSLGGLHDESEIRGHRRTYIGSMPGRIISGLQKAGSSNPVFILDEIDKIAQNNYNGDPSSALLEVLDPEQNNAFHDNYLDVDYDLSHVMFIATANDLNAIPPALLDRMEIIQLSGYTTEEKIEIAKRHLIPREINNSGLDSTGNKIPFNKKAIERVIEQYTRESGVRQLEKQLSKAFRKIALQIAKDGTAKYQKITPDAIEDLLGKPPYYRDIYQGNDYAGVVTGLAWTSVGGEILFIETSLSKGKAGKLTLTGNLGDVMKESAVIALEYVKAHCDKLGVDYRLFEQWNMHIHVPEGATPKDGPSAGITIATSIASAVTQRKVRKNTAMTGEITLRGKVLPVGGIKEKILAAKRAGITDIVICRDNKKDIEEIPSEYLKGVSFHYVENVKQVWDFALTDEIVDNPIDFTITEDKEKGEKK